MPRHFKKDRNGDACPTFLLVVASPQPGHSSGREPVPQALQFTARHVNTNQSGWWLMRPTVNYSSQTLAQSC